MSCGTIVGERRPWWHPAIVICETRKCAVGARTISMGVPIKPIQVELEGVVQGVVAVQCCDKEKRYCTVGV